MIDSFQLPSFVNATLFLVAGGPRCVDVAHGTYVIKPNGDAVEQSRNKEVNCGET